MKIEFYTPSYETIPTSLRLKVNDKQVNYTRSHDKFAYEFQVFDIESADKGLEIVKHLANILCDQSYDHGQEWRIIKIKQIEEFESLSAKWEVLFRIKDVY